MYSLLGFNSHFELNPDFVAKKDSSSNILIILIFFWILSWEYTVKRENVFTVRKKTFWFGIDYFWQNRYYNFL